MDLNIADNDIRNTALIKNNWGLTEMAKKKTSATTDTNKEWEKDLTDLASIKEGIFRSLNGAADENIFIGRASKAGFYCFYKVWRDMPYDAIIDYKGILYRIEVKGSSRNSFNVTRGSRSGRQIDKSIGKDRTRLLSREDCDFVVAIDSNNGDCYIIPEDIIKIIGNNNLTKNAVSVFLEKWKLLMYKENGLTAEQTRDGLLSLKTNDIDSIASSLGIDVSALEVPFIIPGTKKTINTIEELKVYLIWTGICR